MCVTNSGCLENAFKLDMNEGVFDDELLLMPYTDVVHGNVFAFCVFHCRFVALDTIFWTFAYLEHEGVHFIVRIRAIMQLVFHLTLHTNDLFSLALL